MAQRRGYRPPVLDVPARRMWLLLGLLVGAGVGCTTAVTSERAEPSARTPPCRPAPLAERAGRVLVSGLPDVTRASGPLVEEVMGLRVGGIFIGDSNVVSASQVRELVAGLRARAGGPLVVTTDEESGRVSSFAGVLGPGPSPRRLAAQGSPADVRQAARARGEELAAMGVDVDLAPVLDLDGGPANGLIGDRSFSGDPGTASRYGLAYAQGLADGRVLPVAKHFPGQGRAGGDTHLRGATITAGIEQLRASDLVPFARLIEAGVPVVMTSHVAYSALDVGVPASLSPRAYRLLREMGFGGVAMTDSVGMGAVNLRWDYPVAAVRAVAAGADAVLVTDGYQARRMRDGLVEAVERGELAEARLDEAAARVLALGGGDPRPLTCRSVELPVLTSAAGG